MNTQSTCGGEECLLRLCKRRKGIAGVLLIDVRTRRRKIL